MESQEVKKLPYYQRIIKSHHHELEGIFFGFIDDNTKKIEYSEFIAIADIKMIMPPIENVNIEKNIYKILNNNTVQVILNKYESRYFDVISELNNNINIHIDNNYTFEITNLSKKTINNIIDYNKITISKPNHSAIKKLTQETQHKEIIAYGGKPILSIKNIFDCVITYKFIDPVVRMCCEYVIIIDEYFREDKKRIQEYIYTDHKGIKQLKHQNVFELVDSISKDNGIEIKGLKKNSSVCSIGYGIGDECCTHILKNENLSKLSIQHSLFNLTMYNNLCIQPEYLNVNFNTLHSMRLPDPHLLLLDTTNEYNLFLVQILQTAINQITSIAGRSRYYPDIHLLEVLDSNNTTWILRSEHFHLSASPCVHNGLSDTRKINHFLQYLHLWNPPEQLELAAVNWLHTIAHTLDLLYCGRTNVYDDLPINNKLAFMNILKYFGIFMVLMSRSNQLICGVIPNNMRSIFDTFFNDYVELFYYICVNDFNAIRNKLNRKKDTVLPSRMFESEQINEQNLDGVSDDLLIELKKSSRSTVPFEMEGERMPLINDLITRIKEHFNEDRFNMFPFFDYLYAYDYTPESDKYFKYTHECRDIKSAYHCKPQVSQLDWYRFNPRNVVPDDGKSPSNIMNQQYYKPLPLTLARDLSLLSLGPTGYSCATGACQILYRDDTYDA